MKKTAALLLFSAATVLPATAADVVMPAPPVVPVYVPMPLWTGLYIGGQIGFSVGSNAPTITGTPTPGPTPTPTPTPTPACTDEVSFTEITRDENGKLVARAIAVECDQLSAAYASHTSAAAFAWQGSGLTGPDSAETINWDGIFGTQGGAQNVTSYSKKSTGFVGGVHVGYNHQFENNFVIGAVADINFLNWKRESGLTDGTNTLGYTDKLNYLGTVRAKAGFAFDRALVYATGGFAYGGSKHELFANNVSMASHSKTRTGYTVGGGVDFLAMDNLSIGAEYLYTDLSRDGDNYKFHNFFVKASFHFR